MNDPIEEYSRNVSSTRELLTSHPTIVAILDPQVDNKLFHRFLLEFSARGVGITKPVDRWIRQAGERCVNLGSVEIGNLLIKHSVHEKGHHELLISDTRQLVDAWNSNYLPIYNAEQLIDQEYLPSMLTYIDLHESTIRSNEPYSQVAIELEIERMSVVFGPRLVKQSLEVLGEWVNSGLSFVHEHVMLDVGHTALNEQMLKKVLNQHPNSIRALATAGNSALQAYIDIFTECWETAKGALVKH